MTRDDLPLRWQREAYDAIMRGERVQLMGARHAGKTQLRRLLAIRDHERMRGKAWCEVKGYEFVGIQEWPGHESLVLYNLPSGTTKSATWSTVNAALRTL